MSHLVAIHQPNFFPWLGYFDKLARCDTFVLLDHVQFSKKQGNWSNRVQLLVASRPRWVTMPIRRNYSGVKRYDEIEIADDAPWRRNMLRTLRTNYSRAAHFEEVFATVEMLLADPAPLLADFNRRAIVTLADRMGLDTGKIVRSSGLRCEGAATNLLVSIVEEVGGRTYLSGGGADGYQQPERFREAGIELAFQQFEHPVYVQPGTDEFVPGLSCLDALFHHGFDAVGAWLADRSERANAA